jgi:hypothetical protein
LLLAKTIYVHYAGRDESYISATLQKVPGLLSCQSGFLLKPDDLSNQNFEPTNQRWFHKGENSLSRKMVKEFAHTNVVNCLRCDLQFSLVSFNSTEFLVDFDIIMIKSFTFSS